MPVPSASNLLAALALAAGAGQLSFEQAFPVAATPVASHAVVLYRSGGGAHRLELWRDGERRLRRDTDGRLTSLAAHRPGEAGYRLDLFDRARRIHTVVDRDSLYRVGRFTDWRDLAHGLRHPAGAYRVREVPAPSTGGRPIAPCRWYALEQGTARSTICWSAAEGLPLAILDASGRSTWRVTALDHRPLAAATFHVDARGYVLNDAAADISGD